MYKQMTASDISFSNFRKEICILCVPNNSFVLFVQWREVIFWLNEDLTISGGDASKREVCKHCEIYLLWKGQMESTGTSG